jgi:hypothetical protein
MSKSTSSHLMCHRIVHRGDSCGTQTVNRDQQPRCLWQIGNGVNCIALHWAIAVASFNLPLAVGGLVFGHPLPV